MQISQFSQRHTKVHQRTDQQPVLPVIYAFTKKHRLENIDRLSINGLIYNFFIKV